MLENNILLIIFVALASISCINKYAACLWVVMWKVEKNACPNVTGRHLHPVMAGFVTKPED